jgi:hypothetical protein
MKTLRAQVLFVVLAMPFCGYSTGQKIAQENLPDAILVALAAPEFDQKFDINPVMNPFYLRGDFDGDGRPDYAVWIKARKTGESGIAIWLTSRKRFIILGAGVPFRFAGSAERNFSNLDVWQVYEKKTVEEGVEAGAPPRLIGEAILIGKSESGSGLIYWDGKIFKWYQQGD